MQAAAIQAVETAAAVITMFPTIPVDVVQSDQSQGMTAETEDLIPFPPREAHADVKKSLFNRLFLWKKLGCPATCAE